MEILRATVSERLYLSNPTLKCRVGSQPIIIAAQKQFATKLRTCLPRKGVPV